MSEARDDDEDGSAAAVLVYLLLKGGLVYGFASIVQ